MIYSSLMFIYGFLPLSLLIFYASPKKYREPVLLGLSMLYCGIVSLYFLLFMTGFTLINYTMCRITEFLKQKRSIAEVGVASMIIIDITLLFTFRVPFMGWMRDMIRAPEGFFPLGISFFTLSAIGTLIDVYKGRAKAEKNIVRFGLYMMFFPKLLMGPLVRYENFCKVFGSRKEGVEGIGKGFSVFVKGLAKKIIIADTLYMLYSAVMKVEVSELSAVNAWMGVSAYLLCLYFELSGIAEMGCGIAYCFGFRFPDSFHYPILSKRIRFFALRWHMPIMMWFRRYVTEPLMNAGKNKWLKWAAYIVSWTLFGYWYTFTLNGAAAGVLMGTAIASERAIRNRNTLNITGVIYTFVFMMICMTFFSGESIGSSMKFIVAMLGSNGFADALSLYLLRSYTVVLLIGLYASTDLFRNMFMRSGKLPIINKVIKAASPIVVLGMLVVCTAFIVRSGSSEMSLLRL